MQAFQPTARKHAMKSHHQLSTSTLAVGCVAALWAIAPDAGATALNHAFVAQPYLDTTLSGTTLAARSELAGVVLEDTIQSFSFGALNISGTVQNRVVREDGTGTLDFYWRVQVDPSSTGGGISAFRLGNFGFSSLTDADWRIDGLGTVAATTARLFNPVGHPAGDINFLFDPSVGPGNPATGDGGSRFFFLHTDAKSYAMTAQYDLLGGQSATLSGLFSTYAPAVPEPSPAAMLALGLAALGWLRLRRSSQQ
jgi:hypothetical protein